MELLCLQEMFRRFQQDPVCLLNCMCYHRHCCLPGWVLSCRACAGSILPAIPVLPCSAGSILQGAHHVTPAGMRTTSALHRVAG